MTRVATLSKVGEGPYCSERWNEAPCGRMLSSGPREGWGSGLRLQEAEVSFAVHSWGSGAWGKGAEGRHRVGDL